MTSSADHQELPDPPPEIERSWRDYFDLADVRKRRFRRKLNGWLVLYIALLLLVTFFFQWMRWSTAVPGLWGIILGIAIVAPFGMFPILSVRGESRIEVDSCRDLGIYCRKCDASPDSLGGESNIYDWLSSKQCPKCDGKIARFVDDDAVGMRTDEQT